MCTLDYLKVRFPQETGEAYTRLTFGDQEFPVFENYHEVLQTMYGDYMQLPPVEEQTSKLNPKKVEF